jgi:hypothetical protein
VGRQEAHRRVPHPGAARDKARRGDQVPASAVSPPDDAPGPESDDAGWVCLYQRGAVLDAATVAGRDRVAEAGREVATFENKIPFELWQQVEQAIKLSARADRKLKRKLEYVAEPDKQLVTVIMPFTEGVSGEWAKEVDYSQVIAYFSELSQQLFGNIPDLKVFLYRARWKDQDLAQIELSRADYEKINLAQVEDRIGKQAGRTFLELTMGKGGSEASVEKAHQRRRSAEYKKAIDQITKGKVILNPQLK